ncbi:DUF664 domain-containing protein [Dermacoccus abyssi]|uniref:mycothiol transferase n=1 Tax=Dermacoccus abyssi TaxID=322596 RepID=UPI0019D4AEDF
MYLPQIDDERTTLCNYLDVQLDAIRASAYGLDDEQARRTPLRSALSISGIVKHIVYCMKQSLSGATPRIRPAVRGVRRELHAHPGGDARRASRGLRRRACPVHTDVSRG